MTKQFSALLKEKNARELRVKKPFNINLSKDRIDAIMLAVTDKDPVFDFLNSSQKMDFLMFMLEDFMIQAGMLDKKAE